MIYTNKSEDGLIINCDCGRGFGLYWRTATLTMKNNGIPHVVAASLLRRTVRTNQTVFQTPMESSARQRIPPDRAYYEKIGCQRICGVFMKPVHKNKGEHDD